eukprot:TRINITY_DN16076_c1_g1_i1.p1 TRINITY_DN16076_c1_g1~~TRINITY_DN16076_c1_g1_i1.p1  ORF type:complete len:392 (-),score=49.62 TRINITY_DN16076_c1_g1_i1:46-1173(-)
MTEKLCVSQRCSFCNGFRCICANYKGGQSDVRLALPSDEDEDDGQKDTESPVRKRVYRPRPSLPPPPRTDSFRVPETLDELELPLEVGGFKLISLGHVNTGAHFSVTRYIFPVGYKIMRLHTSFIKPEEKVEYSCEILEGEEKPLFKVVAADSNLVFTADTPSGAWQPILKRVAEAKIKLDPNSRSASTISGPVQFGLAHPVVAALIRKLSDADKCPNYLGFNATTESAGTEDADAPTPGSAQKKKPKPPSKSKEDKARKASPRRSDRKRKPTVPAPSTLSKKGNQKKEDGSATGRRDSDRGSDSDRSGSGSGSSSGSGSASGSESESEKDPEVGHLDPKDQAWQPQPARPVIVKQRRPVVFRTPAGEPLYKRAK